MIWMIWIIGTILLASFFLLELCYSWLVYCGLMKEDDMTWKMCDPIAPHETELCNHRRNYIGGDRFCYWCGLDYHHPKRGRVMRKIAKVMYMLPIYWHLFLAKVKLRFS